MTEANTTPRQNQQHLPTFEHIISFPRQYADESWPDFVGRVQNWDREHTEKAQQSGAYRAVPYVAGLTAEQRGLFVTIAWHSYSEGLGIYAPVRLGERAVAALMGDATRSAKGHGADALHALVASGALEVLEEGAGPKPRLLRIVALCPYKKRSTTDKGTTPTASTYREEPRGKTTSSPPAAPPPKPPASQPPVEAGGLAEEVSSTFGGKISTTTAQRWLTEFGEAVVRQQLEWFPGRDVSRYRNGPAAAFYACCRDRAAEPDHLRKRRAEKEWLEKIAAQGRYWEDQHRRNLTPEQQAQLANSDGTLPSWCFKLPTEKKEVPEDVRRRVEKLDALFAETRRLRGE